MKTNELICLSCKHFTPLMGGCKAFPEGIPDEITEEGAPHDKPMKGQDNDIVYEKGEPDFGIN